MLGIRNIFFYYQFIGFFHFSIFERSCHKNIFFNRFRKFVKGCVRYWNRCTTSPTYIILTKWKKISLQSLIISSFKHCHFWKRRLQAIRVLSTSHDVFIKFTTKKSKQASFQIVWRIGMPKLSPAQKSKLFGWNRQPDKRMRLIVSFVLNTKVCKFKKEDWLQIHD